MAPYEAGQGFAGKNTLKLSQYYEPGGAHNMGRIESLTYDQNEER